MREAVERQARGSRDRLDVVMLQRKRRDSLARLGERVYELSLMARLDEVGDDEEIAAMIADVEVIEDRLAADAPAARDDEAVSSASFRPPRANKDVRVWRPVVPDHEADGDEEERDAVRSGSERSETARQARDERVPWESVAPVEARERAGDRRGRGDAGRGQSRGGIAFVADEADGDDDLAAYMHPDDVRTRDDD